MLKQRKTIPVVVPTNYKGGVGKTTTARLLAQGLVRRTDFTQHKPILFIDMDGQANASFRFGLLDEDDQGNLQPPPHPELEGARSSLTDLWQTLLGLGEDDYHPVPYITNEHGIHCVPANELQLLATAAIGDHPGVLDHINRAMLSWLHSEEITETYAAVIIDTPPVKNVLLKVALAVCSHAYVPFNPEPQSVHGVCSILTFIVLCQAERIIGPIKILGLLPNRVIPNLLLHQGYLKKIREHPVYGEYLIPLMLRQRVAYAATDSELTKPGCVQDMGGVIQAETERWVNWVIEKITEEDDGGEV